MEQIETVADIWMAQAKQSLAWARSAEGAAVVLIETKTFLRPNVLSEVKDKQGFEHDRTPADLSQLQLFFRSRLLLLKQPRQQKALPGAPVNGRGRPFGFFVNSLDDEFTV
ncbi:hypothetical protein [Desulfatibacillum aliphaticivorans]|uniref:hypothetical protein n=1 Tax=Desulfatibacillum aliphaticivorans TaxID=218208 RepID=UPI0005C1B192|nr:hypothetical protein [Desulfatibacillum aliphaticivorans]